MVVVVVFAVVVVVLAVVVVVFAVVVVVLAVVVVVLAVVEVVLAVVVVELSVVEDGLNVVVVSSGSVLTVGQSAMPFKGMFIKTKQPSSLVTETLEISAGPEDMCSLGYSGACGLLGNTTSPVLYNWLLPFG